MFNLVDAISKTSKHLFTISPLHIEVVCFVMKVLEQELRAKLLKNLFLSAHIPLLVRQMDRLVASCIRMVPPLSVSEAVFLV